MAPLALLESPVRACGTGVWLVCQALRGMARSFVAGDPLAAARLGEALVRFVWRPLPTLLVLSVLVGIIAGTSVASVLALYNAETLMIGALADVLLRQVLPLIVGIFASGSVSVELAARLGAMSLANEVDALDAMGHDPVAYILGPPVVAVVAASPVHVLLAAAAALLGAALPLHYSANVAWVDLAHLALSDRSVSALLVGLGKGLLFSLIAFAVGATIGSSPVRIPATIGRHTGQAFTAGLLGIFTAAALWAVLA